MSLKGDKYETLEEVKFRLSRSVVIYDGCPVYISEVGYPEEGQDEVARVYFKTLPVSAYDPLKRKYLSSRKFDLSPFKMGYCEVNGSVYWVERVPRRQYVQGLSEASVYISPLDKQKENLSFGRLIKSECLNDFVAHNYRPVEESLGMIRAGVAQEAALWHSFAASLHDDLGFICLHHNEKPFGIILKNDLSTVIISNKFKYLKEEIQETLKLGVLCDD